jgi:hypothetical protein
MRLSRSALSSTGCCAEQDGPGDVGCQECDRQDATDLVGGHASWAASSSIELTSPVVSAAIQRWASYDKLHQVRIGLAG